MDYLIITNSPTPGKAHTQALIRQALIRQALTQKLIMHTQ